MPLMPDGTWILFEDGDDLDPESRIAAEDMMDALLWWGLVRKDIGADGTGSFHSGTPEGLEHLSVPAIEDVVWRYHDDEEPLF